MENNLYERLLDEDDQNRVDYETVMQPRSLLSFWSNTDEDLQMEGGGKRVSSSGYGQAPVKKAAPKVDEMTQIKEAFEKAMTLVLSGLMGAFAIKMYSSEKQETFAACYLMVEAFTGLSEEMQNWEFWMKFGVQVDRVAKILLNGSVGVLSIVFGVIFMKDADGSMNGDFAEAVILIMLGISKLYQAYLAIDLLPPTGASGKPIQYNRTLGLVRIVEGLAIDLVIGITVAIFLAIMGKLKPSAEDSDLLIATLVFIITSGIDKAMDNFYDLSTAKGNEEIKAANAVWNLWLGIAFVSIPSMYMDFSEDSMDRTFFALGVAFSGVVNIFQFILRYNKHDHLQVQYLLVMLAANLCVVTYYVYTVSSMMKTYICGGFAIVFTIAATIVYCKNQKAAEPAYTPIAEKKPVLKTGATGKRLSGMKR